MLHSTGKKKAHQQASRPGVCEGNTGISADLYARPIF